MKFVKRLLTQGLETLIARQSTLKLHLNLILGQAMTLHLRLSQRRSANYLSSQNFENFDRHRCFDYRLEYFRSIVAVSDEAAVVAVCCDFEIHRFA